MSPNYPDHYYSPTDIGYMYCQYTINVSAGEKIHLVFQELNLAFTDWHDFLEVFNELLFNNVYFLIKNIYDQIVDSSPFFEINWNLKR